MEWPLPLKRRGKKGKVERDRRRKESGRGPRKGKGGLFG